MDRQTQSSAADAASRASRARADFFGRATLDGLALLPLVLVAMVSLAAVLYDLGVLTVSA